MMGQTNEESPLPEEPPLSSFDCIPDDEVAEILATRQTQMTVETTLAPYYSLLGRTEEARNRALGA